jgi:hypothetical protein
MQYAIGHILFGLQSATLELTPTLAAPGMGLVVATSGSDVTTVDGTSFAAPFVAGELMGAGGVCVSEGQPGGY